MSAYSIPPETHLGPVHLTVSSLDRALLFYVDLLGFRVLRHRWDQVHLGVEEAKPLVVLQERPGARPKPPRTTGLYHFALLLPSRKELARALRRLAESYYPLQGAADHLVSEALYLADPDGNGIEIYADRPRSAWSREGGQVRMATDPLDVESLRAELQGDNQPWQGLPPGTHIGHVHLQVADLGRAEAFYHQLLGFDLMQRYGSGALFLSAGGYHHHIGLNTWTSKGAPPPPSEAVGLRYFTICLPNQAELERVRERLEEAGVEFKAQDGGLSLQDPSGNGILLISDL